MNLVPKLLFGNALPKTPVSRPIDDRETGVSRHAFPNRSLGTRRNYNASCSFPREHRKQILTLDVFEIRQNLVQSYPGAKQFEQHLNQVSQTADARFSMAYRRINRDSQN